MSDENETEVKPDEVITDVKEELDEHGEHLTVKHLQDLKKELHDEIQSIRRDKSTDNEEKAALESKVDSLTERIEGFLKAEEEKDKKKTDSSTMVVPPKEVGEPTHLNKEEVHEENEEVVPPAKVKRWKRAW